MSKSIVTNSELPAIEDIVADVPMAFERFPVPNYVKIKSVGMFSGPSATARIPGATLDGLPEDILEKLVYAFIQEVYAKAKKPNPFLLPLRIETFAMGFEITEEALSDD